MKSLWILFVGPCISPPPSTAIVRHDRAGPLFATATVLVLAASPSACSFVLEVTGNYSLHGLAVPYIAQCHPHSNQQMTTTPRPALLNQNIWHICICSKRGTQTTVILTRKASRRDCCTQGLVHSTEELPSAWLSW